MVVRTLTAQGVTPPLQGVITRQSATFLCTVCFNDVRFAQLDKCRSPGGEAAASGFAQC